MSVTTINLEMDTEQMRKIFGMQDAYIKKLEQDFQVTIVDRNGSIIITGEEENTGKASRVLRQLTALSDRGNDIEEQNVDYAIEMGREDQEDRLMEMDADCICHTINGKPIKLKTLGQKAYVDAIRKNMIVFGLGPAGTGKSQIAYAVARILKLPWTTLDMSSINDPEQLTGSSRIYANAKPGIIMEAFSAAGESNLVFIINELDKAASGKGNGNPADVLLTLLDNLGFTDNYMECMVPTVGVYPIATANDKSQISAPLMSRFAVIDIPDYTSEEKKIIFSKYVLPKVLKRMSLKAEECVVTEDGLDAIVELHKNTSGIRDLEQAAEHIAANALYQIEVDHLTGVTFNAEMVRELLS